MEKFNTFLINFDPIKEFSKLDKIGVSEINKIKESTNYSTK